jgi:hypothetical protein
LKTLSFCGIDIKREVILEYEFFISETNIPKFQVLIPQSDHVMKYYAFFRIISWKAFVVDWESDQYRLFSNLNEWSNAMIRFILAEDFRIIARALMIPAISDFLDKEAAAFFLNSNKTRFSKIEETIELLTLLKPITFIHKATSTSVKGIDEYIIECPRTSIQKRSLFIIIKRTKRSTNSFERT